MDELSPRVRQWLGSGNLGLVLAREMQGMRHGLSPRKNYATGGFLDPQTNSRFIPTHPLPISHQVVFQLGACEVDSAGNSPKRQLLRKDCPGLVGSSFFFLHPGLGST